MILPEEFVKRMKEMLGDEAEAFFDTYNEEHYQALRLNPLKVRNLSEAAAGMKDRFGLRQVPWCLPGYYYEADTRPGRHPYHFAGVYYIQEPSAMAVGELACVKPGERVLDLCAAPGGKTTHILEICPEVKELVAMDLDRGRLKRVRDNLDRLGLSATVVSADAASPDHSWSPYPQYDRILLDAPCSATGVIRRHPDIKWLRTPDEIKSIVELQRQILENMWQMLKSGGIMLYATCSIEPAENTLQIKEFLREHAEAELIPLTEGETAENPGLQILPGQNGMDGFFYAKLKKNS